MLMVMIAVLAVTFCGLRAGYARLGAKPGAYSGTYGFWGKDLRWHEIHGNVMFVIDESGAFISL